MPIKTKIAAWIMICVGAVVTAYSLFLLFLRAYMVQHLGWFGPLTTGVGFSSTSFRFGPWSDKYTLGFDWNNTKRIEVKALVYDYSSGDIVACAVGFDQEEYRQIECSAIIDYMNTRLEQAARGH
jgi:hypothetical protein